MFSVKEKEATWRTGGEKASAALLPGSVISASALPPYLLPLRRLCLPLLLLIVIVYNQANR
jgi:hypothetical protein